MIATRSHDPEPKEVEPCIPGFSPDPSICNINGICYLVTSSFHLFPGLPIYSSRDLSTWKFIGHAIHRRDQLSLRHSDTELPAKGSTTIATGGLWAPTIRHYDGVTYIVCTNVVFEQGRTISSRQNFIIHTTDPERNDWSDPVYFNADGIDPSIFFDDDGQTYIQYCAHPRGGIWQFKFDLSLNKAINAPELLWEGWDCRFTEGPHIYKKDDYYYLLVAEGGTFESHMISIARSKSIRGPFEPSPSNPLLTSVVGDEIAHLGHGDFFQDSKNKWWAMVLGVRRAGDRWPLGRETFLASVEWPTSDWPSISRPQSHPSRIIFETQPFVHLRDAELSNYALSPDASTLYMRPSPFRLDAHKDSPTFIGKRQARLSGKSSVILPVSSVSPYSLEAGISVYKDEHRYAAFGYNFRTSHLYFEARNRYLGYDSKTTIPISPGNDRLHLQITYTKDGWAFEYAIDEPGIVWTKAGSVDALHLAGRDFTGPILGVFAVGPGKHQDKLIKIEHINL